MAEVDLLKHFSELAHATRKLMNVLTETKDILHKNDEHDWRINDLEDAIDGLVDTTRDLDSIVFGMLMDAEADKEADNG